MALDVLPAKHVDVADNVFTPAKLVIDLRTERTIKTVGIYLFIFASIRALKSSGVRKKYSTPSRSVPRGGRLVALTEK